ncbi:MAG: phosphatidylglycerophosphatase A [Deltaproteobacteria bacterium]|nr:phosphatidylglycerophosphatase A [Deltaproteobacteria bacterium]
MEKYKNFNKRNVPIFISSFFYVGFFPFGPGTAGSFAAFLLYILALRFLNPLYYIALCLFIFIAGVYFSLKAEKISGILDPPFVVIDEALGYLAVMSGLLWNHFSFLHLFIYAFCGFILFRFFDILKPFPIGTIDKKVGGGLGIMLDDLAAAAFSLIVLRFIIIVIAGF